ncbi:hypothetical protein [Streptomyces doebereineriae]|uniref:Uncharacterized protein n=1 Tax=Streptomyces doebereineriae TaxID=3075528 RepID=A0ABU2VJ84_9ACTN|nr:hypothetical protein [Streptomyces sp. DSM 41640]MDT0485259.1 hypothetical protein [Streptomyces sp. DSM 41640]
MRAAARLPRPADVRQDAREANVAPSARKAAYADGIQVYDVGWAG